MLSKLWNCNRLGKIWYGMIIVLLECYSIFNGIRQYVNFKSQYFNPRYSGVWDFAPLHFYVACIILSISLMGFFLYFSLVNVRRESSSEVFCVMNCGNRQNSRADIGKFVVNLVRDKLPYSHILHFTISVILLLPPPVMQMEQIRNEVLSPDSIWGTNIDFFSDHFEWSKPDSLPNKAFLLNVHYVNKSPPISLEFINFSVAALLIIVKLSSVFWPSHRGFSLLFSVLVCFNSLTSLLIYEAGCILIKCAGNIELLGSYVDNRARTQYPVLLILIILQFILTMLGFLTVFVYGNTQIAFAWLLRYKSIGLSDGGGNSRKCWIILVIIAGFGQLILSLVINSLICSTMFKHFQVFKSTIFIITIIIVITNITFNFLVWFTFAIKTKWVFKVDLHKLGNLNDSSVDQGYKSTGVVDAIYGCFHNNVTLSSSSSHSSGPGTMRTLEGASSECSGHGANFQNYIYMQANALHIPTISEDYDENQTHTIKSVALTKEMTSESVYDESKSRGQDVISISDNGLGQSNENLNSDSYRSLQLYDGRKISKLVKFEGVNDDRNCQTGKFSGKRFPGNNCKEKELNFLRVPDILKLNRSNMSCSQSESSIDQVSSSDSSKNAVDNIDQGLCSEV